MFDVMWMHEWNAGEREKEREKLQLIARRNHRASQREKPVSNFGNYYKEVSWRNCVDAGHVSRPGWVAVSC